MIAKLKSVIEAAFKDSTSPGIIVCDCDTYDVFYIPENRLDRFMENDAVTEKDWSQIQVVRQNCELGKELVVITIQHQVIANISKYEKGGTLTDSCTIEPVSSF